MRSNDWGSWGQWPGPGQSRGGAPWGSGPPPWIAGLFGLAQQSGTRAPKVRRGDVRAAILDVLAAEPMNGYQIIQQIAERSGGAWKPSPGSVYPTVQQLEDVLDRFLVYGQTVTSIVVSTPVPARDLPPPSGPG